MIAEQALAISLVNKFYNRVSNPEDLRHLQLFEDLTLHRQHRGGLYGWLYLEDETIGCSIDWILRNDLESAETILGYAKVYAKAIAEDSSEIRDISEEEVRRLVG